MVRCEAFNFIAVIEFMAKNVVELAMNTSASQGKGDINEQINIAKILLAHFRASWNGENAADDFVIIGQWLSLRTAASTNFLLKSSTGNLSHNNDS